MKRRILSIFFALVLALSLGLVTAVPVGADGGSITGAVTLGTTYTGISEWTTETAQCDSHSAKLVWPAPYRDEEDNYIVPRAFANIAIPSGLKVSDVSSWSYWIKAPSGYAPNLTFYVDTTGDGSADTTISAWPRNPDNVWTLIEETTIGGYNGIFVVWDSSYNFPFYLPSWNDVVNGKEVWGHWLCYGEATIMKAKIGKGVIGTGREITAYVDDFTLNNIIYVFEPPPPIEVDIDIKPGSDPNSINLKSKGVVPVAVLTTDDFDASTVEPETVEFASAEPVRWTLEDVNGDGDLDMLFHFKTQELNLDEDSTEATLTGMTDDEQPIEGTDTVNIVPKGKV